jgi:hypothetical protein
MCVDTVFKYSWAPAFMWTKYILKILFWIMASLKMKNVNNFGIMI